MITQYILPLHFFIFLALFMISTLRADVVIPVLPISFAPLAFLLLSMLFVFRMHRSLGIKNYIIKYYKILLLVAVYQLLCLASLFINKDAYESTAVFIRWGLTPVAVQTALPLSVALFLLPQENRLSLFGNTVTKTLFFAFFIFLFGLGIWQSFDISSTQNITRFFIASELVDMLSSQTTDTADIARTVSSNISSILAIRTDFGAIAAVAFIAFGAVFMLRQKIDTTRFFFLALAILAFTAGILSGARVFLLSVAVGLLYLFLKTISGVKFRQALYFIALVVSVAMLCATLLPLHAATKLYDFIPAIAKLNVGMPLYIQDFLFTFHTDILAGRYELWTRALKSVSENLMLGISNGTFRLSSTVSELGFTLQNTHNVFIQSLVDAGLPGFLVFIGLWLILFSRLNKYLYSQTLYVAITASLCVDNFTDHSLPWILITAYLFSLVYNYEEATSNANVNFTKFVNKITVKNSGLILTALLLSTGFIYQYRVSEFRAMPTHVQLQMVNHFVAPDMWDHYPVFITHSIDKKIKDHRDYGINSYLSAVDTPCNYNYPNGAFYHSENEYIKSNTQAISQSENSLFLTPSRQVDCRSLLDNPLDFSHWISNSYRFIRNYRRYFAPSDSIILKYDHISLWTPVFNGKVHRKLHFLAKGIAVDGFNPTLRIYIFRSSDGKVLKQVDTEVTDVEREFTVEFPPTEIYIELRLIDYKFNSDTKEYQSVIFARPKTPTN